MLNFNNLYLIGLISLYGILFAYESKLIELSRLRRNFFDRINTINKIFFIS